jgi:hypothetical protein
MAKCKCCHKKGFMVETDVNGLCRECALYFQLHLPEDVRQIELAIKAIERINHRDAALGRIDAAMDRLKRIKPYAAAGLVDLPMPLNTLETWLEEKKKDWRDA